MAAVARAAGMTANTFRRRFAAAMGCSPQAYALAARIGRARLLLTEEPDLPVAVIQIIWATQTSSSAGSSAGLSAYRRAARDLTDGYCVSTLRLTPLNTDPGPAVLGGARLPACESSWADDIAADRAGDGRAPVVFETRWQPRIPLRELRPSFGE